MSSINILNFVSSSSPNILLIACISNYVQSGYFLKYFKTTHNIYVLTHDFSNSLQYYYDLPSKDQEIENLLNKYDLKKFTVSSISFGGLLAFYLIFYFSERIEKAFIFDFHYKSCSLSNSNDLYNPKIITKNWLIPKNLDTPIVFYLTSSYKDFRRSYISKPFIIDLLNIFKNIRFILIDSPHVLLYKIDEPNKSKRIIKKLYFFALNGFTLQSFWNKLFNKWIINQYQFKRNNSLIIKYFIKKYFS
ncbi:hypothetical protein ABSA28_01144 [Candidatus Hepatincolaceae symbiont of Richtersius coronifer]